MGARVPIIAGWYQFCFQIRRLLFSPQSVEYLLSMLIKRGGRGYFGGRHPVIVYRITYRTELTHCRVLRFNLDTQVLYLRVRDDLVTLIDR